jgi:16S rRNA (cytosine967-C5)-methyltransferase
VLSARDVAVRVISDVIGSQRPYDAAWERAMSAGGSMLEARDRAFARSLVANTLRRHGELAAVLKTFITKPLPAKTGLLWPVLLSTTAQLLLLQTPAHAAIDTAVDACRADRDARHFAGLANAVLRRVAREGAEILATLDPATANIPAWMLRRWQAAYGPETAAGIARASLEEAPLDLSVKDSPELWAERLGGALLPTGSVRVSRAGRVEDLPGYQEGAWWVQDAAAALPARLLGDVRGLRIADLCAAPGGKSAQLSTAGAQVTAVDQSPARITRMSENFRRLGLTCTLIEADAASWQPDQLFDGVLLDAPCSATGTIRRHPDILHVKRPSDIAALVELQTRLIDHAAGLVRPDGLLVYCTCSLEPEEGEQQIARFLERTRTFERVPIEAQEQGLNSAAITPLGELRTLPHFNPGDQPGLSGMDGFFAARLRRRPVPAPAP